MQNATQLENKTTNGNVLSSQNLIPQSTFQTGQVQPSSKPTVSTFSQFQITGMYNTLKIVIFLTNDCRCANDAKRSSRKQSNAGKTHLACVRTRFFTTVCYCYSYFTALGK